MSKKVTLKQVSDEAGVSRAAIYAVLNADNSTNIGVSEQTKKKILDAIAKLNYTPNNAAKTLASGRSFTIGLLLMDSNLLISQKIVQEFRNLWQQNKYVVICDYHNGDAEQEKSKIRKFQELGVDAIIISRISPTSSHEELLRFRATKRQVIILGDEFETPEFSYIAFNEKFAMEQITEHLKDLGKTQIAYLGYDSNIWSSDVRQENLRQALSKSGLELYNNSFVHDFAGVHVVVKEWLEAKRIPQAVVCYNDRIAMALANTLIGHGFVPMKDVYLIGFDNDEDIFCPARLTSVAFPLKRLAEVAYESFAKGENIKIKLNAEIITKTEENLENRGEVKEKEREAKITVYPNLVNC